jgi:hypothetical protein
MVTFVCEEGGTLIAFAQLRWTAAPSCVTAIDPGEIQRLYVARSWHGKGMAQALMAACLKEMERRASDVGWLGVWERNPQAIAFYKKVRALGGRQPCLSSRHRPSARHHHGPSGLDLRITCITPACSRLATLAADARRQMPIGHHRLNSIIHSTKAESELSCLTLMCRSQKVPLASKKLNWLKLLPTLL